MDRLYCCPSTPSPPALLSLHKPPIPSASSFLLLSPHSTEEAAWGGRGKLGWRRGTGAGGTSAITWKQTLIMATVALLHFHSCGVAHLWAPITDQMIQTGPSDEEAGLTEWLALLFLFACVYGFILCFWTERSKCFRTYMSAYAQRIGGHASAWSRRGIRWNKNPSPYAIFS